MRLLFATGNRAKVRHYGERLAERGIEIVTLSDLGIQCDVDESGISYGLPTGAFVQTVVAGGAAEKAGMLAYDIIIELNDQKVTSLNDLTKILRGLKPGDETKVKVYRSGSEVLLTIVLDEKPQQTQVETQQQTQPESNIPQSPFGGLEGYFWPFFG